jgi:hypothetical protein
VVDVKVGRTAGGRFQGLAVAPETSNVCVHPEKERERMKCSLSDIEGLKPSTRRLLERWGRNGSERGTLAEPARTRLKAGTVLVREWHGVTHRVSVL